MFEKIKTMSIICPICEAERDVQYGTKKETLDIRKEKIEVTSKKYYCPTGDHFFSNIEDDEEKIQYAYREYRKRRKLIQPEEIKQIRMKYGLSQNELSLFLGYGKKTINRYETGALPDAPHSSLIRLIENTKTFRSQFDNIKDNLPAKLIKKIETRLGELEEAEKQLALPYTVVVQAKAFSHYNLQPTTILHGAGLGFSFTSWVESYITTAFEKVKPKTTEKEQKELAVAA